MRILHTSDWHFGRTLHGVDLTPAIDLFCQWLVDFVRSERIDVVLISGDVYDRSIPSTQAVRQLQQVLTALADDAAVILTSGNHDSATRLGFAAGLMRSEVHFVTSLDSVGQAVEVSSRDGQRLLVYPLPYLEPELSRHYLSQQLAEASRSSDGEESLVARSHQAVMDAAMKLVTQDLEKRRRLGDEAVALAMVHAFITGGTASDSERRIEIGGVEDVAASTFDLPVEHGLDYVAAGHLHRPQNISGAEVPIRYSGSPVAYSFSEAGSRKSVTVIEIQDGTLLEPRFVELPIFRELAVLRGSLEELLSEEYAHLRDCFVSITVTDAQRPARLKERIRNVFPHLVVVLHESSHTVRLDSAPGRGEQRSDQDICRTFFEEVGGGALTPSEAQVLSTLMEEIRLEEAQR